MDEERPDLEEDDALARGLSNALSRGSRALVGLIALLAFGVGGAATFLTTNQWAAVAFVVVGAFLLVTALLGEMPTEIRAGADRAVVRFGEHELASRLLESLQEGLDRGQSTRRGRILRQLGYSSARRTRSSSSLEKSIEAAITAAQYRREPPDSRPALRHTFVSPNGIPVAVIGLVFDRTRTTLTGDFRALDREMRRCLDTGIRHTVVAARWASGGGVDRILMPFLAREHGNVLGVSVRYVDWPAVADEAARELRDSVAHFDGTSPTG